MNNDENLSHKLLSEKFKYDIDELWQMFTSILQPRCGEFNKNVYTDTVELQLQSSLTWLFRKLMFIHPSSAVTNERRVHKAADVGRKKRTGYWNQCSGPLGQNSS